MATVRKDILIEAPPEEIWSVVRDFATCPQRMAPGFVVDVELDGPDVRIVTFATGAVARERFVALDDDARRTVFSIVGGTARPVHDNASMQVLAEGAATRFVWIHDVLPDELAPRFGAAMERGLHVFKQVMEASPGVGARPGGTGQSYGDR
jgi:carbon monoxide dehydrogenase subunit G